MIAGAAHAKKRSPKGLCGQEQTHRVGCRGAASGGCRFRSRSMRENLGLTVGGCSPWTFSMCSPMLILMSFGIQRRKLFVVECKRCRRDVPAGVPEFPFQSIVVACPLCGELRRYLPSEVVLGTPHHLVAKQARAGQR